jgi:organic radical activating enzyme
MEKLFTFVNRIFKFETTPPSLLPQGMYHYQSPADEIPQYRLHLRVEPDGTALLIINAHTTLHLNQTAAEYAFYLVNNASENTIINTMKSRYQTSDEIIRQDMSDFKATISRLAQSEDLDPTTYFGFDRTEPYSVNISAPYRLDCALTYQTTEMASVTAAPVERVKRELLTEEWINLLEKAWAAGIPHVIFTGGEPTLRPDLPEIIAAAQTIGQVTGLLTDGSRLSNSEYFHTLLNAGLDHLLIVLDPTEEQSWEAIRDAIAEDIFVTVHFTLSDNLSKKPGEILDKLKEIGVKTISLSAAKPELSQMVKETAEYAAHSGLSLVWDLPVPYSAMNPISLDTANGQLIEGAGKAWLYVEPDGDVLPAQSINKVMGNLLNDPWESIWAARSSAD